MGEISPQAIQFSSDLFSNVHFWQDHVLGRFLLLLTEYEGSFAVGFLLIEDVVVVLSNLLKRASLAISLSLLEEGGRFLNADILALLALLWVGVKC